jgi:tetratricopeptide (TPR) repeat protein
MKSLRPKFAAPVLLLLLAGATIAAEPAPVNLLSLGRVNDAISVLTARNDPESYHLLSRAYYATEHWDDAVRWGERAVAAQPQDANYHLWLAREYGRKAAASNPLLAAGIARKAKVEFEHSVELDASNVPARVDLAEYYTEAPPILGGGLDKARDQAMQVARYDVAKSHLVLARIAEKEKRYSAAENELRQAIKLAGSPADYWVDLASFYRLRGLPDEMQSAVQQAVEQRNKPAQVYFDAAETLYLGGRNFPSAAQYLQTYLASGELVEAAPAFRAHYRLGQIYEKMGRDAAAVSEYQASLALASGFDRARRALGHLR